MVNTQGIW